MMHTMMDDILWLSLTKPQNVSLMVKEISELRYKSDGPNSGLKLPSKTKADGGDCEDMALFVICRLFQMHRAKIGFILFSPEEVTPEHQAHICAISARKNGEILVFDPTGGDSNYTLELQRYIKIHKKHNKKWKYYRVHWMNEDNSKIPIMEFRSE